MFDMFTAGPYHSRLRGVTTLSALLNFDLPALTALVEHAEQSGRQALDLEVAALWCEIQSGSLGYSDVAAADLQRRTLDARKAALVIEVCAARALLAESAGDQSACVENARRASRMARTEGLPEQEFLANLVLARARRGCRHPHLALRVLTALAEYATPQFHPWMALELLLCGLVPSEIHALLPLAPNGASPAARAVRLAYATIETALHGDVLGFRSQAGHLLESLAGCAPLASDFAELIAALDAAANHLDHSTAMKAWRTGQTDVAPPSVHGLCVRAESEAGQDGVSECYVVAQPDAPPCRILGVGAPLLESDGAVRLRRTRRKQGRVETMAAVLALAGPQGASTEVAFARAYGFSYVEAVHRGVVDVLMQRVRAYLGTTADLVRADGHVRLAIRRTVLVPDPRSAPQAYDRLLRLLARQGSAKAVDAARASGLSVRAAQNALKELMDAGLCTLQKRGRQVVYAVEDTTFSEPTKKLRRSGL